MADREIAHAADRLPQPVARVLGLVAIITTIAADRNRSSAAVGRRSNPLSEQETYGCTGGFSVA